MRLRQSVKKEKKSQTNLYSSELCLYRIENKIVWNIKLYQNMTWNSNFLKQTWFSFLLKFYEKMVFGCLKFIIYRNSFAS